MEASQTEDIFNIMLISVLIIAVALAISFFTLLFLTRDVYLDAYFVLDAFFDAQNTAASSSLASIAFSSGMPKFSLIFIIMVIDNLSRILITSFILAAVLDFIRYINIEEFLNEQRAKRLKGHVIICGYNELAEALIEKIRKAGAPYLVLEKSVDETKRLNVMHIPNAALDFTDESGLIKAGLLKAKAIVFATESDADNTLGSLIARRINPNIKIFLRLKDEKVRKKAYIAGANMAVIPEYLAGLEIGEFLRKKFKGYT